MSIHFGNSTKYGRHIPSSDNIALDGHEFLCGLLLGVKPSSKTTFLTHELAQVVVEHGAKRQTESCRNLTGLAFQDRVGFILTIALCIS